MIVASGNTVVAVVIFVVFAGIIAPLAGLMVWKRQRAFQRSGAVPTTRGFQDLGAGHWIFVGLLGIAGLAAAGIAHSWVGAVAILAGGIIGVAGLARRSRR